MKKILGVLFIFPFFSCNAQAKFDLDKILQNESKHLVVIEIDGYLNKKSNYGFEIDNLNASQRVVLIVENLEREINNGGFHQFYYNSSGNFASETVEALKVIGAKRAAQVVQKANSEFPNGKVPKDWDLRDKILSEIALKASENWNELDAKFYRPNKNTGEMEIEYLTGLLYEFIISNKSDFVK